MTYKLDLNGELTVNDKLNFSDKFIINEQTTTIKNKLDVTQTALNDAISSNLQDLIIQTSYPVGSLFISTVEMDGIKSIDDSTPIITWHGCVWTPYTGERFIRGRQITLNGSTWSFNGEDETGGSATHSHTYGIRYADWHGLIHRINEDNGMFLLNNNTANNSSSWNGGTHQNLGNISHNLKAPESDSNSSWIYETYATLTASNIPPYTDCYIYKRIG